MPKSIAALLLCLALALAALPGLAQDQAQEHASPQDEPITGAFGFELGQVIDPATLQFSIGYEQSDGNIVYDKVVVPKPSRFFDLYSLEVDPADNTIVVISGFKDGYTSKLSLQADANELIEILTAKYGPGKDRPEMLDYELERDGKSIGAGGASTMLGIIYTDVEAKAARKAKQAAQDQDAL